MRLEGQRFDEGACRSQRRIEIFVGQVSLKRATKRVRAY